MVVNHGTVDRQFQQDPGIDPGWLDSHPVASCLTVVDDHRDVTITLPNTWGPIPGVYDAVFDVFTANPTPAQTGKLLNFHWSWLNHRPVLWTVAIVIAGVGSAYFALVQRRKPTHLQAPEGEVFATELPEMPAAGTT